MLATGSSTAGPTIKERLRTWDHMPLSRDPGGQVDRTMFCAINKVRPDCGNCVVRHISLCSHISPADLADFQALSKRSRFDRGRVVIEQDGLVNRVLIITRGVVKLYRAMPNGKRQVTGFLGSGDLLGSIKRSANAFCTAQAITDLEVCGFKKEPFSEFLRVHPSLCFALLVTAMDEIEAQYDHSILLSRKAAPERLAAFLLLIGRRWKKDGEDPNLVHTLMPRHDIADHLGVTSETISRTFSRFKADGLINIIDGKSVLLTNTPRLRQLAGFQEMPPQRMMIGL